MRILPGLLLLAGLLTGCGPALTFTPPPQTGHYRNEKLQLCLQVPPNWEIREGLAGQVVVCLAPRGDAFRENLVVTTAPADTQARALEDRLLAELPGWRHRSEGVSPQGYPWFTGTHSQAGQELTALVVLAARKDQEFVLTFTAPSGEFPKWEPIFQAVLPTIHLDLKDCPPPGPATPNPGQTPATPAAPETPVTPAAPASPAAPETPATPKAPASPAAPETPATPKAPASPAAPRTP